MFGLLKMRLVLTPGMALLVLFSTILAFPVNNSTSHNQTESISNNETPVPPVLRHDGFDEEVDHNYEVQEDSPYVVVEGRGWLRNAWAWLMVTPQHHIYVPEPQLPWYGNLIKWLRINVLFEPVY